MPRLLRNTIITAGVLALAIASARLVYHLPSLSDRTNDRAFDPTSTGHLAEKARGLSEQHPGMTGIHPLHSGPGAFAARVLLADAAEHTIDAQYYIWHRDLTGLLLLRHLRDAADRGVRVRLLLDDNDIDSLDPILAELDRHQSIDVRLYNPFVIRRPKVANYLFDFTRLNLRMHNKSFTVDGAVTVAGGRNVGDEYFGTGTQPAYVDLDVLAAGAVVPPVSADFQLYWESASAYPLAAIVERPAEQSSALDAAFDEAATTPQLAEYRRVIAGTDMVERLAAGDLPFEWLTEQLVSDTPAKTLGRVRDDQLLVGRLSGLMDRVDAGLDVISPYFVPGRRGTDEFVKLARRGVRVRVLTNSLEATDVLPVHAGYAKYRRELLEGGVELFELKAGHSPAVKRSDAGLAGSSGSSLHAKTFAADGERIFIGSFNFDPRSVHLNTEMGMVLDSPVMAERMSSWFDDGLGAMAYRVRLDADAAMQWEEADGSAVQDTEPNTTWMQRAAVRAIGWLPVQWLL